MDLLDRQSMFVYESLNLTLELLNIQSGRLHWLGCGVTFKERFRQIVWLHCGESDTYTRIGKIPEHETHWLRSFLEPGYGYKSDVKRDIDQDLIPSLFVALCEVARKFIVTPTNGASNG